MKQAVAGWIYKAKIMRVGRPELLKSIRVSRRCKREQKRGRWHSPKKKPNNAIKQKLDSWQLLLSSLEEGIVFVDSDSLLVQLHFCAFFFFPS